MSHYSSQIIPCPTCGQGIPITVFNSLNITMDPGYKEKVLSGELFTCQCSHCDNLTQVNYPFLYHDMERKIMIWHIGQEDPSGYRDAQFPDTDYRYRFVRNYEDLQEKIRIYDRGHDDRVVELFKWITLRHYASKEYEKIDNAYYCTDDACLDGFFGRLKDGTPFTMRPDCGLLYEDKDKTKPLQDQPDSNWLIVDRAWAEEQMALLARQ